MRMRFDFEFECLTNLKSLSEDRRLKIEEMASFFKNFKVTNNSEKIRPNYSRIIWIICIIRELYGRGRKIQKFVNYT